MHPVPWRLRPIAAPWRRFSVAWHNPPPHNLQRLTRAFSRTASSCVTPCVDVAARPLVPPAGDVAPSFNRGRVPPVCRCRTIGAPCPWRGAPCRGAAPCAGLGCFRFGKYCTCPRHGGRFLHRCPVVGDCSPVAGVYSTLRPIVPPLGQNAVGGLYSAHGAAAIN